MKHSTFAALFREAACALGPEVTVFRVLEGLCITNRHCAVFLSPWRSQVQTPMDTLNEKVRPVIEAAFGTFPPSGTFAADGPAFVQRLRAELPCDHTTLAPWDACTACLDDETGYCLRPGGAPIARRYAHLVATLLEEAGRPPALIWQGVTADSPFPTVYVHTGLGLRIVVAGIVRVGGGGPVPLVTIDSPVATQKEASHAG